MSAKQEKICPACNGTGTVVNLGVPEECPMCDDEEQNTEAIEPSKPRRQATHWGKCPNHWCNGELQVKSETHPKANIRCDKCGWTMYLSNWRRLDERALEAKRKRERMLATL